MITIELIPYNPASNGAPVPSRGRRSKSNSILDAGGTAVLILTLVLFAAPMFFWATRGTAVSFVGSGLELKALVWVSILAIVLPLLQILAFIRRYGGPAVRSNRELVPRLAGAVGRIARAHSNLNESLLPFAIAVVAAQLLNVSNVWTVAGAGLFVASRLCHALSYVLGITVLRSASYYAGAAATGVILAQLPSLVL